MRAWNIACLVSTVERRWSVGSVVVVVSLTSLFLGSCKERFICRRSRSCLELEGMASPFSCFQGCPSVNNVLIRLCSFHVFLFFYFVVCLFVCPVSIAGDGVGVCMGNFRRHCVNDVFVLLRCAV